MYRRIIASLAVVCLCSCQTSILTVQTEYLSHENLASFQVGTPDPRLRNPPLGQKLIVNWSIPLWDPMTNYELLVKVRFKNGVTGSETISIDRSKGSYVYTLINEDYFATGGLKTYLAVILYDGKVMEEWRHQLWANVIEIPNSDEDQLIDEDDEPQTDQEIYDEHYKGEGGIQRPIEDITDPDQAEYKYYF